jgi:LEA14-like dessication related protein
VTTGEGYQTDAAAYLIRLHPDRPIAKGQVNRRYNMSTREKILFLQVLLFLLPALTAGCSGLRGRPEPLEVSLANMNILQVGLFEQRYLLQLRIQNPNDFSLPIKGMKYQLYLNEKIFARGVSGNSVTIPGFGEALVDIEGISNISGILDQLYEMGEGGKDVLHYRLSGSARLGNQPLSIPFEYKGEIRLPVPGGADKK